MNDLLNFDLAALLKKINSIALKTVLDTQLKNSILLEIAAEIEKRQQEVIAVSEQDYLQALENQTGTEVLSRLKLDAAKVQGCISGLRALAELDDPIGQIQFSRELDDGLILQKKTYPIGTIAVIFEARPDVIVQVAGLAVKTGNFMILKPGQEAQQTCSYLMAIIHQALLKFKVPLEMLTLFHSRTQMAELLKMDQYIDLIIPRGSKALVEHIQKNTQIPVMGHADGICHIFADSRIAEMDKAIQVIVDAKTQYPAACNAVETVLLHRDLDRNFLKELVESLEARQVQIFADQEISAMCAKRFHEPASWQMEYGDLKISLRLVDSLEQAIEHINCFGSHHTDCILTESIESAEQFMRQVDSANVYHNCSTRFADGYRYGFGAEVGISTHKILERGPVALEGLTTYKYHVYGSSHLVANYAGAEPRTFKHKMI